MSMPRDTPDHLLRESLRTWENLRDLLASALPGEVENFDFSEMEEVPREFFTGDWREREADLIFEVGYRLAEQTTPALVGVLVEHQTQTDQWIPFRALFMLVNYWERRYHQWQQAARGEGTFRLPPVFCVVLYTGPTPWGSNTNVRQLLDEPAALHPFAPDWGPQFWNLAARSADDLLGGPPWMQLMAIVRVAFAAWVEYERVLTQVNRNLKPLADAANARWSQLMRAVYSYSTFRRPASEHPQIRAIVERENPARVEEVRTMEKTIVQSWQDEAKIEHAQTTLRRLLEARGFTLSVSLAQQIAACNELQRLDAALIRVVQVKSIDEFSL
jgi:hypothetical protein